MTAPQPRFGLALIALVLGVAACSSSGDGEPDSGGDLGGAQSAIEIGIDGVIDDLHAYAEDHEGMTDGLQRQLDVLSDRVVTESEYRQGFVDARECMLRQGLEVSEINQVIDPSGWQFMMMFEPGAASPTESEDIADRCQSEHSIFLANGWAHQEAQTLRPEYKDALDECFAALGEDTAAASRLEDYIEIVGRGEWSDHECQHEAREVIAAQNAEIEWW